MSKNKRTRNLKETALRYQRNAISLIKSIDAGTFVSKDFTSTNNVSPAFVTAAKDIGIIEVVGKTGKRVNYKSIYSPTSLPLGTGERIRESISYTIKRQKAERLKKKEDKNNDGDGRMETSSHELQWQNLNKAGKGKPLVENKAEQEITLRKEIRKFIEQKFAEVEYHKEPVKVLELAEVKSSDLIGELQKRNYEGTLIRLSAEEGVSLLETFEINIKKVEED